MTTTFELNANDLDTKVIRAIKSLFKDRQIRLTVDTEMDETEYLLSTEANQNALFRAIENAKNGNVTTVNVDELVAQFEQ